MIHLYFGALLISILFFIFTGDGQINNFSDPTFQFIFREWFTNPSYAWPFIIVMGFIGAFAFYFVFNAYSICPGKFFWKYLDANLIDSFLIQ